MFAVQIFFARSLLNLKSPGPTLRGSKSSTREGEVN